MTTGQLIAFNLVLLAAVASPGPALLYALRATLAGGRLAGVLTGLGLALMASIWTLLALLGLNGVFALFPSFYLGFKLAGATYLIVIAVRTWRDARTPLDAKQAPVSRAFVGGMLINAANPKSVLFAAAVLVSVFPAPLDGLDKALVVTNHLVVEVLFYGVLATAMSSHEVVRRYLRAKVVLDRVAAVVLGALGARLIVRAAE